MSDRFQLKALITGVDRLSPMLKGIRGNVAGWRKQMEKSGLGNIGLSDVLRGGAIAAPFIAGVKQAIEFESAMADVRKVVDFDTPEQFKQMGDDVVRMSTRLPMAARDIAAIVAAGGQAGIGKSDLTRFAEDAVKMGIAFDQTAEQSGEMMAKWRTAFRATQDEVVVLADQINYLGNTGPANARQISSIVTRLGPLGEVAGLATRQVAAMGATLAGVGITEEVAATGMKNLALQLTAGASAGKKQQAMWKALRMDSAEVARGMQEDAQGTILRVLQAINQVDRSKQAAVLQTLFGRESVGAIAPLLTNLDLLRSNFEKVADASEYAGSMEKEYAARAATTANMVQLNINRAYGLGKAIGNVLLPGFNRMGEAFGPVIEGATAMVQANPWLVKAVLGAAVGFTALRIAVMASTVAMKIFGAVTSMTPIGLIVRGIALAAGVLIANWSSVAPFFRKLWAWVGNVFRSGWELFQAVGAFSPLGMVVRNWEPLVAWFKSLWDRIRPYVEPIVSAAQWVGDKVGGFFFGDGPRADRGRPSPGALTQQLAGRDSLTGDMVIRFENAPPGMRTERPRTNQPGFSITPSVGYRSLGQPG